MKTQGLKLWKVTVSYAGHYSRQQVELLVLTRAHSSVSAHEKARRFLRINRFEYPQHRIDGISYSGTIDA